MADVFTVEKRSAVMSHIRASGNRDTELRMIEIFRTGEITGWRRKSKLFGKPDFVFPKQRVVVFVDGCFWHRHRGCKFAYTPKSQVTFWLRKFKNNVARDKVVSRTLRKEGWRILRIWECDLAPRTSHRVALRIKEALRETSRP
jgi:DNA mismatch endonuclease, patch repair protein